MGALSYKHSTLHFSKGADCLRETGSLLDRTKNQTVPLLGPANSAIPYRFKI